YPVIYRPPQETSVEMLQARENLMKSIQTFLKKFDCVSSREKRIALLLAHERFSKVKEYLENSSNAIATEEPDNSLSEGDEHLSTILEMESDEVIKSSVENLVPILSESKGIFDDTCDVPFCDNSPPLDVLNDQFELFSDFNDDCT
nr:hypothetical protein [Tanacetum cinerariifolium]